MTLKQLNLVLVFLRLCRKIPGYLWLYLTISGYLPASDCLDLSRVIPGYIQHSRFILSYFWAISGNYWLYLAISVYLWLFLAIWGYLGIPKNISEDIDIYWTILGYIWLSLAISGYLWLSLAISGYLWLSLAISDCL